MNRNRARGGIAAVTAVMLGAGGISAFAYEAPENMELSIGTVEIDRDELCGDTGVEVPIYLYNNPGIISLKVVFDIANGLYYEKWREAGTEDPEIEGVNIYNCKGTDRITSVDFTCSGSNKFHTNGQLGVLRVVVPEDTPAGRYEIAFTDGYDDEYITVLSENDDGATWGKECFSKLGSGAVIVKEPDYMLGDVNYDGQINADDASSVLSYYAMISTNQDGGYTEEQKLIADANRDGMIDADDSSDILSYYAYISTASEDVMSLKAFLNK